MIRLSPEAEADLRDIVSRITRDNGKPVALRIYRRIRAALLPLDRFPHLARAGRIAGTRELVIPGLPFIAVYQIETDGILVVSIIHGAMQWPPGDEAG